MEFLTDDVLNRVSAAIDVEGTQRRMRAMPDAKLRTAFPIAYKEAYREQFVQAYCAKHGQRIEVPALIPMKEFAGALLLVQEAHRRGIEPTEEMRDEVIRDLSDKFIEWELERRGKIVPIDRQQP